MIGVFGGTFDPIHYGHLRPAFELLEDLSLAEVRLVPANRPPHREPPEAGADVRRRMVEAAIEGIPGLRLDDRELHRKGPSYTVDTLASLHTELGGTSICLFLGMDAFSAFDRWHEWLRILELAHLVVAQRPGSSVPETGRLGKEVAERLVASPAELNRSASGLILLYSVTQLEISATEIRGLIAADKSPRFLLPDKVLDIIEKEGLYRSPSTGVSAS